MAQSLARGCATLGATLAFTTATVQGAETVNYFGAGGLQPDPFNSALSSVGPSGIDAVPDGAGSVDTNIITVNYTPNGTNDITGSVYGAFRWDNTAVYDNRVTLNIGTVAHSVYGAYSYYGTSSDNIVALYGGSVGALVFGGYSASAAVTGNQVSLTNPSIAHSLYGGYSGSGAVNLNQVVINSGTVDVFVYGGYSSTLTAAQNWVTLYGGSVGQGVFGGYGNTTANANTVTMTGGTVANFIIGGYSNIGDANNNTVSITGGAVGTDVSGGSSAAGTVSGNSVTIDGGAVGQAVYGGFAGNGNAVNNRAELRSGAVGWGLHGGYGQGGSASGNTAVLSGGTVGLDIVGGLATGGGANDNATANTVIVSGGLADRHVIGGYANVGNATGNIVTIEGGAVSDSVYGGYVYQGSGNATGNTVNLAGNPTFGLTTRILGGETTGSSGDMWTGNTLNVSTSGLAVAEVNNFANYNFYLPANLASGGTMITITGATPTNLAGTTTVVTGIADGSPLLQGNRVTLISSTVGSPVNTNQTQELQVGVVRIYDLKVYDQAGALYAEIVTINENNPTPPTDPTTPNTPVRPRLNPQTASFPEGRAAGLALVNQGGDLMQGGGLDALRSSTRQTGLAAFGTAAASNQRIETGSHVDIDGFSLMAGLGKGLDLAGGRATLGFFFETGTGDYDAYNSLASGDIRADGDADFFGGGLLGRYDTPSGWHAEVGVRTGHSETDYASGDIVLNGRSAAFSSSAWYGGGHLGVGRTWQIGQDNTLDLSTKLLYTHLDGDEVTILGDPVQFGSSDSLRWRTGVRFETAVAERFQPYMGAAYEHEFDGEIEATTYGMTLYAPSLEGGTGIGEVGLRAENLLDAGSLSLDLGMQGFVGQREGLGIQCRLRWLF